MANIPLSSVYTFAGGFVQDRNTIRALAQSDDLNAKRVPNSTLLKFLLDDGAKFSFHLLWTATELVVQTTPQSAVVAAGPDGRVNVGTARGDSQEQIGRAGEGPGLHGVIRDVKCLGSDIVAVGMGRQAYRRDVSGSWSAFHQGILQTPDLRVVRGFNAVHGLSGAELVAVGWYGEIYRWTASGGWGVEDSGTNLILNDVHVTPDGTAYACGQKGLLLRNSHGAWQQVAKDCTDDEIRSLQWFDGRLYMSTDEALLAMDSRDRVTQVKVSANTESTFDTLHAADGVLLSVGPKDICWTTDAKRWNRLD
jgi:hypothetical protein